MIELNLMVGIPGSGKSTWLRNYLFYRPVEESNFAVSRDEIRFELMDKYNTHDYFEHEKEVWDLFVKTIQSLININCENELRRVWVDSTLINKKSRYKLLNSLDLTYVNNINIIFIDTPIDECIDRNNKRFGRKRVPDRVVIDMFNRLEEPTGDEKYSYNSIMRIIREETDDMVRK